MKINISEKSIVVCGIVRNAAKGLTKNIPVVNKVCQEFKDYHVIMFENDSVDNTKELLLDWHSCAPEHVHIFVENLNARTIPKASTVACNPFFSLARNEKMSGFRNKYMNYIETMNWNPDYLMVIDMDVSEINEDGILASFETNEDWDVITAFGYSMSPSFKLRYHDTYILVENGEETFPQTEQSIKKKATKYAQYINSTNLIPVYSAYGGLAIYKYEKVRGLRYKAIPNNDKRVESRGEHFSLYEQMHKKGDLKVYINPKMKIKYQSVDLQLVLKTLKRTLGF